MEPGGKPMKLGKTSWLILGAGIFVIVFASLGTINSQRLQERSQLNEELAIAVARLNKLQLAELSSNKERLEMQLEQTISQFEAAKATLTQPTIAIDVSDNLYRIAEAAGVEITEISSTGLTNGDLEGITTSVLPFTTTVEGNVSNLINFVTRLNADFMTGVVKSVEITSPNATSSNTTGEDKPRANIRLVVHTYQGD